MATPGELAPRPVPHGQRRDLRRCREAAGTAQVHAVSGAVVEQGLDAGIAGQPLRGGGGQFRSVSEAGGAGGGVEVHDHLRPPALDHRPGALVGVGVGVAVDQREQRVRAARGHPIHRRPGFLFLRPLVQVVG